MSGYLTAWRMKPDTTAGRILKVISEAGDACHHTEGWCDPYGEDNPSQMDIIEECVESEISALESSHAELLEAMKDIRDILAFHEGSDQNFGGRTKPVVLINAEYPGGDFPAMLSMARQAIKNAEEKQ